MSNDASALAQYKAAQREGWSLFAPLEVITTIPAASLVTLAEVRAGQSVLDVACGTGVVAVTAARAGARVSALDLSPVLLERARKNAATAAVEIEYREGDVEELPYGNDAFDVVLSQFGHMFAPRPSVAIAEMLRVLKPGGRIAFSTWPPEMFAGRMFAMMGQFMQPLPGLTVAPPPQWGSPDIVRERLGDAVTDLFFDRGLMTVPALSPRHYRELFEVTAAPVAKMVASLQNDPARLSEVRASLEALITPYFEDNCVRQHFLMTRARKRA